MNDTLLIVMNARAIPECIDAIRDLRHVDRAWCSYYNEAQLSTIIPDLINRTQYTRYAIISDDCIPTQTALDTVLALHDAHPTDFACGWINVDATMTDSTINLEPLHGTTLALDAYTLITVDEARNLPPEPIRTYFHGMNLTIASREQHQRYPFNVYNKNEGGCASDFHQCVRLQADDIPIWTHPAAEFHHVKERHNLPDQAPRKRILVGTRPARVTIEQEWA